MDDHHFPKPANDSRDTAHGLREQAASCRRLANDARTRMGRKSLHTLADHFDAQALKIEVSGAKP